MNTPEKMRGRIVGSFEDGWIADMTHPDSISGVMLHAGSLCLTKSYPDSRSRVRITDSHCPDLTVRQGAEVVALVTTETEETGRMIPNPSAYSPNRDFYSNVRTPNSIPELMVVSASAERWGLQPES